MGMSLNLGQHQKMQLILAPRMIQSMEILQLPIMALQERIEQELQENPMLELETTDEERKAAEEDDEVSAAKEEGADPDGELIIDGDNELDFNRLDALSREWEDTFNEESRPSRNGIEEEGDRKLDAMQNMPARPQSLQEYLAEQLTFLDLNEDQEDAVRYLISHIDENGRLAVPLEAAARDHVPPLDMVDAESALRIIQQLDPPGVGARDLVECLLLQVTLETPNRDVLQALISHHLEDIEHNRLPIIHRKTGFDLATIKVAIDQLRHLDPKPGSRFLANNTQYVMPDIIVERTEAGEYEVRLVEDWTPNLHISRNYVEMLKDKSVDPKIREYLKRKVQSAMWLKESIEQRRSTLERVTRAIIQHQRAFLDKGPEHIEPLKMQQIADQVGVHVTTVSRAVDDKWVQTPRGVFPLKRFFGGGTQTLSGEEVAWETIKQKLLELIGNEDKENPLSDEDLVTKLEEAGYPVARRTVTKYRKMLNIPSSRQRKEWTE